MNKIERLTDLQLEQWLQILLYPYYRCTTCGALHLLQRPFESKGVVVSVDCLEDQLQYTVAAAANPSAILSLMSSIGELNATYTGIKLFIDLQPESWPQLVASSTFSVVAGITFEQFTGFLYHVESSIESIVKELFFCDHLIDRSSKETPFYANFLEHKPAS
eukprot:Blabericola_migrator_1__10915@NODE_6304_length_563_cov_5_262097_g4269_i0_p1_GENE_NODE_6304_length_563_cov_5_262097_g4269_i0NODE_6304_length_563_cov_5_262097_g4269_i0_p1_ORF_typecomplete_len162_score1_02YbjN/PF10722_9/3_9e05GFA/PF04828_14/0_37GFA/PF04828_14/3_5e03Inhibitor_I10/PF12559_8/0_4_NODE_6304_length_563_cov_5_262097_g4269_i060545